MDLSVFDPLLDGVAAIDGERHVLYCNPAFAELCGTSVRRIKAGTFIHDLLSFPEAPDLFCMPGGTVGRDRESAYREANFMTSSARNGVARICIQPVSSEDGERFWLVILRDMTLENLLQVKYQMELAMREQALADLLETQGSLIQNEKMATIGQLVAGISHELNNPLAIVRNAAVELIGQVDGGADDIPKIRQYAEFILHGTQRMARLSSQLRSYSHGPLTHALFVPFEIAHPIRNAIEFTRHLSEEAGVAVEADLPGELPAILGDENQIEQIAINLIRNAIDAFSGDQRKGIEPIVLIRAELLEDGRSVCIRFEDNGPGIPADVMKKLFTPFYSTKGIGKGTGLGLSISRSIAEKHGGRLEATSTPGESTSISLLLPTHQAQLVEPRGQMTSLPKGFRILVVDDEPWLRSMLVSVLERHGCVLEDAASGEEALTKLGTFKPELIVSDLAMPGMNGSSLAKRAREVLPSVRFVLVTGSERADDPTVDPNQFDAIVLKPFSFETLQQKILRVLRCGEPDEDAA